ncbi:DMT family transporter [Roseovarius arcticus]|uniref:DMT family transporter n=1 Tax=Roseovarius arcticus TaxID=2547404 RepID=UPI001110B37A|nr:DMT family transporter [Roseovarius arcticus]
MMPATGRPLTPVLLTFCSAILWGLWWITIRWIESMGLSGAQAGIVCNLGAALAIGGYMLATRMQLRLSARTLLGAVLVGLAFACYSLSLTLSDVVRAILLFYLAPAWSKIIEWVFLGQCWQGTSTVTLILSLGGAYLVLGGDVSLAAITLGDALALISGVAWAIGAALIFSGQKSTTSALTLATVVSAMLLSLAFAWGTGEALPTMASAPAFGTSLAVGAIYLLPVLGITMWSAQRLPPGLLSFLFTLEIVAGVVSGALLLDEPFGLYRMSGGVLIIGAALIEAIAALRPTAISEAKR